MEDLNQVRIIGKLISKKRIGKDINDGLIIEISSKTSVPFCVHIFQNLALTFDREIALNDHIDLTCNFVYLDKEMKIIGLQVTQYYLYEQTTEPTPF